MNWPTANWPQKMPRVIVVGAGIAGLTIARDLARGGMNVTLLEKSDRVGGKVARHTVAGIELDSGAESFATRKGTVAAYAAELAIGNRIRQPNAAGAWLQPAQGHARPLPRASLLGMPGTPLAADVISVVGSMGALRAQLDGLMPGFVGSRERNLGALVRLRMGRAVLDKLVTPVVVGIHSTHPDALDVDVVAPGLRTALLETGSLAAAVRTLRGAASAGSAISGLAGGMFELVEALSADLYRWGATVRTGCEVSEVHADAVVLAEGTRLEADIVVLATTLGGGSADLPNSADKTDSAVDSIVLATLVLDCAELDAAPRGTGLLVAPGATGVVAKALTHSSAKWPWLAETIPKHSHALRLSYQHSRVGQFSEAELSDQARADAQNLLGIALPPSALVGFARVDWAEPARSEKPISGVTVVGEAVSGTGLAAVIGHARREAEQLLVVDRSQ